MSLINLLFYLQLTVFDVFVGGAGNGTTGGAGGEDKRGSGHGGVFAPGGVASIRRDSDSQNPFDDSNEGYSGVKEIPPWAWEAANDRSLPTYCFLPIVAGNSTGIGNEVCNTVERYSYNASHKICLPFEYLGCGGNTNNFVKLEFCQDQCMPHPKQGGCDPNVKQSISTLSDLDADWGEN